MWETELRRRYCERQGSGSGFQRVGHQSLRSLALPWSCRNGECVGICRIIHYALIASLPYVHGSGRIWG